MHKRIKQIQSTRRSDVFEVLRGLASLIVVMESPRTTPYSIASYRYVQDTAETTNHGIEINNYLKMHDILSRRLNEELKYLMIQGYESIGSKLLFILASMVKWTPLTVAEVVKYANRINELLQIPIPPWAESARVIDLLNPGSKVLFFLGSILTSWIIGSIIGILHEKRVEIDMMVCLQEYEDYINLQNAYSLFGNYTQNIYAVDCGKPENIIDQWCHGHDLVVNSNYLSILSLIDALIADRISTNVLSQGILFVFNPKDTPMYRLVKFGQLSVVASLEELINLFTSISTY